MTFKQLIEKGLKKLFLKNSNEIECEKWELLAHFNLRRKINNNFKYECEVDMKIFYYDDEHCYVETECLKGEYQKDTYFTTVEIIKYEDFFNHIFDVNEYIIRE